MCISCWEEYGKPEVLNDATAKGVRLANDVYKQPRGGAGGNLHIVLDDWNIEDDSIRHCMDTTNLGPNYPNIDTTLTSIERECAEHFLTMTMHERATVLATLDGLVQPGDPGQAIKALGTVQNTIEKPGPFGGQFGLISNDRK